MSTTVYTNDFSSVSDGTRLYTLSGWELSASTQGDYNASAVVNSGHLRANSTNGVLVFRDAGGPDHFSEVVFSFTASSTVQAGPAVRCDSRTSFIGMRVISATTVDIYYKSGSSTATRIGSTISLSVVAGMRVRLQVDGDTVKLYANGSEVASSSRDITGIGIKCGKAGVFLTGNSTTNLFDEVVYGVLGNDWLMIDNIIPRQVHPAIGTTYTKSITGSYGGTTTPTAIEFRVRDFITGTVINDWATLDAAPTGGAFAGSVTLPKGNWYNIETRFANATAVNNWSSRLGIGLLFEFGGQSNVVNLFAYRNTTLIPAEQTSTYEHSSGKWRVPEFSSITILLNALSSAAGCVVSGYVTAVTGSQIAFHLPGGGNYATRTAALAAVGGKMSGFYWGQGETDAENGSLTYEANLASLYADQQTITGQSSAQLPMFIVQLGRKEGFTVGNVGWSRIRSNQVNFVAATANTYISHQTMDLPMADSLHRNESGYAQECLRAVDTMSNVLLGTANNGRGPIPTGVTLSGADVNIAHNLNGSASLSLPTSAQDGYQVSNDDFATTLPISSISTSGANITLTMATTPTGTVKVRSQWGQDPDNAKMPTGSKTYNSQAVMVEPIINAITASVSVPFNDNIIKYDIAVLNKNLALSTGTILPLNSFNTTYIGKQLSVVIGTDIPVNLNINKFSLSETNKQLAIDVGTAISFNGDLNKNDIPLNYKQLSFYTSEAIPFVGNISPSTISFAFKQPVISIGKSLDVTHSTITLITKQFEIGQTSYPIIELSRLFFLKK